MRVLAVTLVSSGFVFGLVAAVSQWSSNTRYLGLSAQVLRSWSHGQNLPADSADLVRRAREKARRYHRWSQRDHRLDGMIVNRGRRGSVQDECDSLLFSSLRYVALKRLGWMEEARTAWLGMQNAHSEGRWKRHPRCTTSTSRDMILGLLVALAENPPGAVSLHRRLMKQIEERGGFFADGPIYVSYTTPRVAQLIYGVARHLDIPSRKIPPLLEVGFSTSEWSFYYIEPGYEAHLVALSLWLEMELREAGAAMPASPPWSTARANSRHLERQWIAHNLVQLDPQNLFFRYLRFRSVEGLTPAVRLRMLRELLAMGAFPDHRLPMDCDRKADYLWQRASWEYEPHRSRCHTRFHGTDYLWMTALLLDGLPRGFSAGEWDRGQAAPPRP